jgi:hypothetical protein
MYIPACAMTRANLEFVRRQRDSALRYTPPPDFPGAGGDGERDFKGVVHWEQVGQEGKQAMGLGRFGWKTLPNMSEGERRVIEEGNKALFA